MLKLVDGKELGQPRLAFECVFGRDDVKDEVEKMDLYAFASAEGMCFF